MKKNILSSLFIIIIFTGSLFAQEEEKISLKTVDTIEIGLQSYWYKYGEEFNELFFMSNTGFKYGGSLTGINTIADDYFVISDIRLTTGYVEYKSASGTGSVADNMYELRILFGKDVVFDKYLLSLYIGAGYRYLYNDLRDLGSGGYRRESSYRYIPLGVTHRFMLNTTTRISTTFEYDYFVNGKQKSYLSDVSLSYATKYGNPINKQNNGYGMRISTVYEKKVWSAGMFFNYWNIKDSEINYYPSGTVMEPKNYTQELGVELKYRF